MPLLKVLHVCKRELLMVEGFRHLNTLNYIWFKLTCSPFSSFNRACRQPSNYTNGTQWIVNDDVPSCKYKGCSALSNEKIGLYH